ncbi:MAG: hypothetical protein KDK39_08015 [Leptospiraceae bacterium]|nr:hypothetical protein [Leptospiraceae bacterium]
MRTQPGWLAVLSLVLWMGLAWPARPAVAQSISSFNAEKMPQTRDPRYIPPLFSTEISLGQEASGAALLLGNGDNLGEYLQSQQKEAIQKRLENSRYVERETRRMLKRGAYQSLLERELIEQVGKAGFAPDAGQYPYQESKARRFTIVFLLALPITGGLSFGAISLASGANQSSFSGQQNLIGGLLALGGALGVAWYDQNRVAALLEEKERGQSWPPPLETRDGYMPPWTENQGQSQSNDQSHYPLVQFTLTF